jgi:bla regulator protein blaR1
MSVAASSFVIAMGWTLVHFLWQGLLLGCATAIALTVMRNVRPQQRYIVACAALLLCLAWPAFALMLRIGGADGARVGVRLTGELMLPGAAGGGVATYLQDKLAWLVGFWALCAAALTFRMALGLAWIGAMARGDATDPQWQARLSRLAQQFGVTRTVRLRVVQHLPSPMTARWWRPVVLLPASLISGMPPDLLEALLAHELAHIKRFDYLVNLVQNVIEIVLFYHPAVWWISRQIRLERELIADDLAARELGEPRRLALALSELERFQFSTHHLAQAANAGDLMSRIKRLIAPTTHALSWKAAIPILGLLAACIAGCAHVGAQDAATRNKPGESAAQPATAQFSSCKKPQWPAQSLRDGNTGTVTLGFLIGADGNVLDSTIYKSSGYVPLDEAARNGIRLCKFTPGTEAGQPVQAWVKIQYVWTLR